MKPLLIYWISSQKYRIVKLITINLVIDVTFSVGCFLCNLSKEEKFEM